MTSKEAQLLSTVDVSQIDSTLPFRAVTVPSSIRSAANWGLIVAVHGAAWNGRFNPTRFYWDPEHNEVMMVLMRHEAALETLDAASEFLLQDIFQNDVEIARLNDEAIAIIGDNENNGVKRQRQDDALVATKDLAHAPANPAAEIPQPITTQEQYLPPYNNNNQEQAPAQTQEQQQQQQQHQAGQQPYHTSQSITDGVITQEQQEQYQQLQPPLQQQQQQQQQQQTQHEDNPFYGAQPAQRSQLQQPGSTSLQLPSDITQQPDGTWNSVVRVHSNRIGLIIGQAGKTIRLLKSITHATITIDQNISGGDDRVISVSGTRQQVEAAELEIRMVLALSQSTVDLANLPPNSISQRIEIPSDAVGAVIGKGGDTIRLLQIYSHAHVQMEKEPEVPTSSRGITLTGTSESIAKAKGGINDLLSVFAQAKNTQTQFNPQLILFKFPNTASRVIIIDNSIVGHVIGIKGANFNQIRKNTGCQIQMDSNTRNPKRELTIIGPNDAVVNAAVDAITKIVTNAQQSVGQRHSNVIGQQGGYNQDGGQQHQSHQQQQPHQPSHQPRVPSLQHVVGYGHQRGIPQQPAYDQYQQQPQPQPQPQQHQPQLGAYPAQPQPFPHAPQQPHQQHQPQYAPVVTSQQPQYAQQQPIVHHHHHQQPQPQPQQQPIHQMQPIHHHQPQPQQQQQQQQPIYQQLTPAPRPTTLRHVAPEHMVTFWNYYDHYIKSYPQQQALEYAHHYIDHPPQQ